MSPDAPTAEDLRAYAARHGLNAGAGFDFERLAQHAATVAATGRAIPRYADPTLEPASVYAVHLDAAVLKAGRTSGTRA